MHAPHAETIDASALQMLVDSLQRYGQDRYSFEHRRALLGQPGAFGAQAWADYAAMGWLACAAPQDAGGFDNDPAVIVALMRYVGEHLAMEPVLASAVLCGAVLSACGAPALPWLAAVASGEQVYALAHAESADTGFDAPIAAVVRAGKLSGAKVMVLHGDGAHGLVVSALPEGAAQPALYRVDAQAPGVTRRAYRLVDQRMAASFQFDGAPAQLLATGEPARAALALGLRTAALGLCAEAHGAIRALNRLTLAHLKERQQFGRPIGANQALQHRMVELFMLEQEVSAAIAAAQRACAEGDAQARRAIHGALAHAMSAARLASHESVQMHGGMGITDELPVSHYFRRIMVINRLLGERDHHLMAFIASDRALNHPPGDTTT